MPRFQTGPSRWSPGRGATAACRPPFLSTSNSDAYVHFRVHDISDACLRSRLRSHCCGQPDLHHSAESLEMWHQLGDAAEATCALPAIASPPCELRLPCAACGPGKKSTDGGSDHSRRARYVATA